MAAAAAVQFRVFCVSIGCLEYTAPNVQNYNSAICCVWVGAKCGLSQWRTEGVVWGVNPPPEIPKISVESSIARARRIGVSISFCSSLCSHMVVIYYIKVSFNTNCLAVAYLVSEFKPTPTSRKFDKDKPDCKLSGKCLVFLFQHPN